MAREGAAADHHNQLVSRSIAGDIRAFEELHERHQRQIYSVCRNMLSDEQDAADVTQEVFLKAFESLGRLRSSAAFVTWLNTTAVNLCRDRLRRRMRRSEQSLDAPVAAGSGEEMTREMPDEGPGPEALLVNAQMREAVRRAIATLGPDYREVVALFYGSGMEVSEIACVLKRPVGTVKSRLARARGELKRKLAHLVEE